MLDDNFKQNAVFYAAQIEKEEDAHKILKVFIETEGV